MTVRRALAVLLFALLLAAPLVHAQATFAVGVVPNTDHPDPEARFEVYAIDGVQGRELTLTRGQTYTFTTDDVPGNHPFYISTSEVGQAEGEYSDGVTGNFATQGEVLTFFVPMDAPDLLYYQCQFHQRMGWRITVVNPTSTTEGEAQPVALALSAAYPNPFAEYTQLTLTLDRPQTVTVDLFTATGRLVATLHDGTLAGPTHTFALNIAGLGLADGTYLVRATAGETTVERRVTLVR